MAVCSRVGQAGRYADGVQSVPVYLSMALLFPLMRIRTKQEHFGRVKTMERAVEDVELPDEAVVLEEAVVLAIAACDGDLRATIRALLVSNTFLTKEVERLRSLISPGFARGRLSLLDLP
jgi:hypothetical protein